MTNPRSVVCGYAPRVALASRLVRPEPAAQLAALRVVVAVMILVTPEVRHAPDIADGAAALRVAPEGLAWFVAHVPIARAVATAVQAACAAAAFSAIVGVYTRPALVVLAASSTYLFSLSQLSGAVWHDMHLLWMAALLAASPCDEALAYDARARPVPEDSTRYGLPLTFARALLACIYFFPGLHKLLESGLAWALSDNLQHQLWWKWAEHGVVDPTRVDRVPGLLQAGGLFVLAFELSFPILAFVPRTRAWAAVAGLAFHLFAGWLLRIPFVSLWALYVVLLPPRAFARFARGRERAPAGPPWRTSAVVGALLVAGAFVQGARGQMRSYPFACYPTFQWRVGTDMPDLVVEVETADGARVEVRHARDANGYRTQRQWGEIWSLAGVTSRVDTARLRAYVRPALVRHPDATRVRVWRAYVSVVPERRGEPPRRDTLLLDEPVPFTR